MVRIGAMMNIYTQSSAITSWLPGLLLLGVIKQYKQENHRYPGIEGANAASALDKRRRVYDDKSDGTAPTPPANTAQRKTPLINQRVQRQTTPPSVPQSIDKAFITGKNPIA